MLIAARERNAFSSEGRSFLNEACSFEAPGMPFFLTQLAEHSLSLLSLQMRPSCARSLLRAPVRQLWSSVRPVPPDPILGLVARYKKDPNPKAVNLAQGAYRDADGKPFVLSSVVKAERRVLQKLAEGSTNKEYLGSEGNPDFLGASIKFAFGESSNALAENRVAAIQVRVNLKTDT